MDDLIGQQIGQYRLLRLVGAGSFASVYLGEHQYLKRHAALKIVHVRMEPANYTTFLQEARTIARLNHPHIVRVQDFGMHEQIPYLVLDYLPNGTLRTRHLDGQRLPLEQIIPYVNQLASALDYAHQQQIIHRDVKPANVLLTDTGEVVLSDFGLAIVQDTLSSLSEQKFAGTPQYVAPEQIQGHPCPASDQYALGVMVYNWLCGAPPFTSSGLGILIQHLQQEPPSLCERVPGLSPAVNAVVLHALAKDPTQRFETVGAFAHALYNASALTQPLDALALIDVHAAESIPPDAPVTLSIHDPARTLTAASSPSRTRRENPWPWLPSIPIQQHRSGVEQNRQRLSRLLRHTYETLRDTSLQEVTRIEIKLAQKADAVTSAANRLLQIDAQGERQLPAGTSVIQVYEDAQQELLILGDPGAGKSTLLVELALYLVAQVEYESEHQLPVIVPLSSWAAGRTNLENWLGEQISQIYNLPRKLSQQWVREQRFLPLLDGLDEMEETALPACIAAINTYHREHPGPLVVCSRATEYAVAAERQRLALQNAVVVQPLSLDQVNVVLTAAGPSFAGLSQMLVSNSGLQVLATMPLMLNLLLLTYQETAVQQVPTQTKELQQQVLQDYVARMAQRKGTDKRYPLERIYAWLHWLAYQMRDRNQTVFYLEHLQPDWLPEKQRHHYQRNAVCLPAILLGILGTIMVQTLFPFGSPATRWTDLFSYGIFGGLLGWLWSEPGAAEPLAEIRSRLMRKMRVRRLLISLSLGLLFGIDTALAYPLYELVPAWELAAFWLCSGAIFGSGSLFLQLSFAASPLFETQRSGRQADHQLRPVSFSRAALFRRCMLVGCIYGLILGLRDGLSQVLLLGSLQYAPFFRPVSTLSNVIGSILLEGLLFYGAINLLVSLTIRASGENIQITDHIRWSGASALQRLFLPKHLLSALLLMLAIAMIPVLLLEIYTAFSHGIGSLLSLNPFLYPAAIDGFFYLACLSGFSYWVLFALLQGLQQGRIEDRDRRKVNQGIHRSLWNSLFIGSLSGILIGIISFPIYAPLSSFFGREIWLEAGLALVSGTCFVLLLMGGIALVRHYTIRRLLARSRILPWQAVDFLDDATARVLLRRVGGGYSFMHRQLLDFFADHPPFQEPEQRMTTKEETI